MSAAKLALQFAPEPAALASWVALGLAVLVHYLSSLDRIIWLSHQ